MSFRSKDQKKYEALSNGAYMRPMDIMVHSSLQPSNNSSDRSVGKPSF